jgi:FixJ family two-component response regulator
MRASKLHIAIVDDDESVRRALTRLLSTNSIVTETFGSAQEFLTSLLSHAPECLILDLHMPDITGLDLQYHLLQGGFSIPTIVITAHDDIGLRERCEKVGAKAFLVKPVDGAVLIDTINKVSRTCEH